MNRRVNAMHKSITACIVFCLALFITRSFGAVGGGDLTFSAKNAKPVFFSHAKHVDGKQYKCTACHYHVFQMAKDSYKMDMSKITKGQFCGTCHNGDRSFAVNDKKSCDKCHK
jgi:c(7)-type cytochrome triheme protein